MRSLIAASILIANVALADTYVVDRTHSQVAISTVNLEAVKK